MRTKNTDYISAIEKFVSSYLDDTGVSPTIREISDGTGLTKSTVADYVAYMRESGILDGDGSHRSLVGGGHGVVGGALQLMDLAFLGHYMFVDGPVGGGLSPVVDSIF